LVSVACGWWLVDGTMVGCVGIGGVWVVAWEMWGVGCLSGAGSVRRGRYCPLVLLATTIR